MNDFLKSLTAFGMEGMNAEVESVDAYAGSEVAEELIELDNIEAQTVAMESMSDAIMEGALEMQTIALEAAGLDLGTASNFSGELSTEAIVNMAKRGYYEVKIQVKKAIQKIWKLILSIVDQAMGSNGRLKSYGKLFKKYRERLAKISPKDGKDGEDKEVTIRSWAGLDTQLSNLKALAGDNGWIKEITSGVKSTNVKVAITGLIEGCKKFREKALSFGTTIGRKSEADVNKSINISDEINDQLNKEMAEKLEKKVSEILKDIDAKDFINDIVTEIKDVDSSDMSIWKAKGELLSLASKLEEECKKDLKFKNDLIKLRKAWDKKTGEFNLNGMKGKDGNEASQDVKDATAAILRTLNMFGPIITGFRMFLSKVYSAVASNLQGCLADMAKVIAKGTNIGA